MAREDVVVQNILQVRVERLVDVAEVLAQPLEDEQARLLLVARLKGPDAEFAFHACLLLLLLAALESKLCRAATDRKLF
jgi:hypothetical protein